jgi:hypothetical protein
MGLDLKRDDANEGTLSLSPFFSSPPFLELEILAWFMGMQTFGEFDRIFGV